jgi:hypothetical protein
MDASPKLNDVAGYAALAICESLLLALTDLNIIQEKDARSLLEDAVAAHHQADSRNPAMNAAVAAIIGRILAGKNSLPHP